MTEPKTECPVCSSENISSAGVCMDCGERIPETVPEPQAESVGSEEHKNPSPSGAIEMDYSEGSQQPTTEETMPQWRKELSERLKAIKEKKEETKAAAKTEAKAAITLSASRSHSSGQRSGFQPKPPERVPKHQTVPKPLVPIPRQKPLQPLEKGDSEKKGGSESIDPHDIQKLIDNAVSRQSVAGGASGAGAGGFGTVSERFVDREGKLILLSRTLSGLVDLICVVLCTVVFIIALDVFSGIIDPYGVSPVILSVLFLLIYFVYSLFFLISSNQTIGMMITNLRVVGADRSRPAVRQLIYRSCGHLGSLFGLGIGLLLSLFNRENLCFHDRISGTRVIRT